MFSLSHIKSIDRSERLESIPPKARNININISPKRIPMRCESPFLTQQNQETKHTRHQRQSAQVPPSKIDREPFTLDLSDAESPPRTMQFSQRDWRPNTFQ